MLRLRPPIYLRRPGNPDKIPLRASTFQAFVIFPIHANPWAVLCKVAGLLDHSVMVHPPGSDLLRFCRFS
ncbi:hypothetical protein HRG_013271 [Hirsutella rhossiliensis]